MVVTLERHNNKLVLGAFVPGDGVKDWEYWEGKFGPAELAAHVSTLYACSFLFFGGRYIIWLRRQ